MTGPLLRALKGLSYAALSLITCIGLFAAAAVVSALVPIAGEAHSQKGPTSPVYVCATLAHADIVLPQDDPLISWDKSFPAIDSWNLRPDAMLAFGWGDIVFFRETPNWADVRLAVAFTALTGQNGTALRIMGVRAPVGDPDCIRLELEEPARAALIRHIVRTRRADGSCMPGLTRVEMLCEAVGHYSPLSTCNQWVADALASAGLPHAWFAPFSFDVMWPLQNSRGQG